MQLQLLQILETPEPNGCEYGLSESYSSVGLGFVARQTGHPDPFQVCKHVQWNTCWQSVVMRPEVSSMRSRHTMQVGSSMRFGVGGGNGLRELASGEVGEKRSLFPSECFL